MHRHALTLIPLLTAAACESGSLKLDDSSDSDTSTADTDARDTEPPSDTDPSDTDATESPASVSPYYCAAWAWADQRSIDAGRFVATIGADQADLFYTLGDPGYLYACPTEPLAEGREYDFRFYESDSQIYEERVTVGATQSGWNIPDDIITLSDFATAMPQEVDGTTTGSTAAAISNGIELTFENDGQIISASVANLNGCGGIAEDPAVWTNPSGYFEVEVSMVYYQSVQAVPVDPVDIDRLFITGYFTRDGIDGIRVEVDAGYTGDDGHGGTVTLPMSGRVIPLRVDHGSISAFDDCL